MEAIIDWIVNFPRRPINHSLPPSLLLYLIPPLPSRRVLLVCAVLLALLVVRLYWVLPASQPDPLLAPSRQGTTASRDAASEKKVRVAVFLGSGGHTTEIIQLLAALPTSRYSERLYLYSSGDRFSLEKAQDLERRLRPIDGAVAGDVQILEIPRARKVHQSFLTTPLSLAYSLLYCLDHVVWRPLWHARVSHARSWTAANIAQGWTGPRCAFADLVLMNGPGTCVPIVAAVYALKLLGFPAPKLIYVESFARVKSLSLTAKLLRPVVDRFVVQWPEAGGPIGGRTSYNKWLI
ncbi:UDP-N-acetylglucosamine transferase subunit [Thecaphora frezii]|nr:putative glycosyltransferase family 1 protein [Thecaphora frezii]